MTLRLLGTTRAQVSENDFESSTAPSLCERRCYATVDANPFHDNQTDALLSARRIGQLCASWNFKSKEKHHPRVSYGTASPQEPTACISGPALLSALVSTNQKHLSGAASSSDQFETARSAACFAAPCLHKSPLSLPLLAYLLLPTQGRLSYLERWDMKEHRSGRSDWLACCCRLILPRQSGVVEQPPKEERERATVGLASHLRQVARRSSLWGSEECHRICSPPCMPDIVFFLDE
ncbi:hypothetical protein PHSY_001512 [Pseudozyma hubeiensis SY62]|uniref:Uncharacterized protein n=1 Tax=Pseudozyma hubeiensis (strain SY62) TaxID=1305764 RepID=R9NYQ2_PSEHS|nr:hypothetical protein PHSY_001512 [Pseudozyma hubeiensis SY62]GAC93943.1 hypothetical protein PHSY_001512 [Pseudozyma hubeiensis SY62]